MREPEGEGPRGGRGEGGLLEELVHVPLRLGDVVWLGGLDDGELDVGGVPAGGGELGVADGGVLLDGSACLPEALLHRHGVGYVEMVEMVEMNRW